MNGTVARYNKDHPPESAGNSTFEEKINNIIFIYINIYIYYKKIPGTKKKIQKIKTYIHYNTIIVCVPNLYFCLLCFFFHRPPHPPLLVPPSPTLPLPPEI